MRSVFLVSVLVCTLTYGMSCNRIAQEIPVNKGIAKHNMDILYKFPAKKIPKSHEELLKGGNKCSVASVKTVDNVYYPQRKDSIFTISCIGYEIGYYFVTAESREFVISVKLVKNMPDVFPELIGIEAKELKRRYGEPDAIKKGNYKYVPASCETGDDSIIFGITDDKVTSVEWEFPVD